MSVGVNCNSADLTVAFESVVCYIGYEGWESILKTWNIYCIDTDIFIFKYNMKLYRKIVEKKL